MITCPNCHGEVRYAKIMTHSLWTPISCDHCGGRMQFDKRDYFKKALLFVIPVSFLAVATLLHAHELVMLSGIVLSCIGLISFILSMKTLKLITKGNL